MESSDRQDSLCQDQEAKLNGNSDDIRNSNLDVPYEQQGPS
jgi:hypothetical protein